MCETEINEIDGFELSYYDQSADFKMPTLDDIVECFNTQFNTSSIPESNHQLLEKLYISGDKTFLTNPEYLDDLSETLGFHIDEILGRSYKMPVDEKKTQYKISFDDKTSIVVNTPSFKINRKLMNERYNENFTYMQFLKEVFIEMGVGIPFQLLQDPKKMILGSIQIGSLINRKKIELKKKRIILK